MMMESGFLVFSHLKFDFLSRQVRSEQVGLEQFRSCTVATSSVGAGSFGADLIRAGSIWAALVGTGPVRLGFEEGGGN